MTIYAALPFVRRSGMYSVRLPNLYNVSFDYYYCLIAIMLSYIPCKKICFMCTCMNRYSDKCRFFVCFFASVSSALLPHAAAEKKGASRGGHRGEGRLNRLPPLASVWAGPASTPPSPPTLDHHHHHHRSLSRTRGALPSLSGNTGSMFTVPLLKELETEAGDHGLFILLTGFTAPLHVRRTTLHLPRTDPIWENCQFLMEVFFKATTSIIQFFHHSRVNLHVDNMLLRLCMSVWTLKFLLHITKVCLLGSLMSLKCSLWQIKLQDCILNIRFTCSRPVFGWALTVLRFVFKESDVLCWQKGDWSPSKGAILGSFQCSCAAEEETWSDVTQKQQNRMWHSWGVNVG